MRRQAHFAVLAAATLVGGGVPAQPSSLAGAEAAASQAGAPGRQARAIEALPTDEQQRLKSWLPTALAAIEAPPADNTKALTALQEGERLLTGQTADVLEAWGAYGMLAQRLGNADAQSKAVTNLLALGADRSEVQGLRSLVALLQAAAPKPAPAAAPPAPAAQPQPTPTQPAEDPALARRTARKALLDGLKALPRDDANRASLDALTAMVERAVAADRTLTRVQERTLVLIVQQLEQAPDETVKAEKQAELVTALANALATAPENPRHWALLIQVAKDMPDEQTLTLDLGEQHKFTATGGMLVRGGVACLELLGAENSEDNAVVDGLVAGRLAVTAAERAAAERIRQVQAAQQAQEAAAADRARLASSSTWIGLMKDAIGRLSSADKAAKERLIAARVLKQVGLDDDARRTDEAGSRIGFLTDLDPLAAAKFQSQMSEADIRGWLSKAKTPGERAGWLVHLLSVASNEHLVKQTISDFWKESDRSNWKGVEAMRSGLNIALLVRALGTLGRTTSLEDAISRTTAQLRRQPEYAWILQASLVESNLYLGRIPAALAIYDQIVEPVHRPRHYLLVHLARLGASDVLFSRYDAIPYGSGGIDYAESAVVVGAFLAREARFDELNRRVVNASPNEAAMLSAGAARWLLAQGR